ncbi:GNAT family N-acetyltransferase [Kaustia mangrovi]|uniref:GNAT family N-acetyltransferase n=1 Tax=Kaustia mangrovi TaxID=2593653 RepID=UPI001FED0A88|nr:GNAT family N-acetyltransferase [Kaustia mangrovi]
MAIHDKDAFFDKALIRKLWPGDVELFREHLKRLDPESRRMRFGGAVSDIFIDDYADTACRLNSVIHGCFVDGVLRAAAELRPVLESWPLQAEAAFSVETPFQDSGLGTELMHRTIVAARNRGINTIYMICLRENGRMRHIAQKHKADLRFEDDEIAGTVDAPYPTYFTLMEEFMGDAQGFVTAVLNWR